MTFDLSQLRSAAERRLALRVTPDALRQIRSGHPWVYDGSITSSSHEGQPGDLAVVFDNNRDFAAIGLWDPASPIRLKVLHAGRPATIDAGFWRERLSVALAIRQPLIDDAGITGMRLVHGENDGLPGLVVDRYSDVVVVKLYTEAWVPHLKTIIPLIAELASPNSVVLRLARNVAGKMPSGLSEGTALTGPPPEEPVLFLENNLRFEAHPTTGQKTGHFLDQRDNRRMVRDLAKGASVLDVFSCTGAFAIHAAAGGARSVHCIDIAPEAIETFRRNITHNSDTPAVAACDVDSTVGDAFNAMYELADRGRRFDMVIVDPPSFAQRQVNVDSALNAYSRLTKLALNLLNDGGLLVQASCSSRVTTEAFHNTVAEEARSDGVHFHEIARTTHSLDHPIGFAHGAYLKAVFATAHKVPPGSL